MKLLSIPLFLKKKKKYFFFFLLQEGFCHRWCLAVSRSTSLFSYGTFAWRTSPSGAKATLSFLG